MFFEEIKSDRKPRKKQILQSKFCNYCQKLYWAYRRDSKFCSENCRQLAYHHRKKGSIPFVNPIEKAANAFLLSLLEKLRSVDGKRVDLKEIMLLSEQIDMVEKSILPYVGLDSRSADIIRTRVVKLLDRATLEANRSGQGKVVFRLSWGDKDFLMMFLKPDPSPGAQKEITSATPITTENFQSPQVGVAVDSQQESAKEPACAEGPPLRFILKKAIKTSPP
jgi:predicted nucleic acid-binding Zn ribbon protein